MPDDQKPVQRAQRATRKPSDPVVHKLTYSEQSKLSALLYLFFKANADQDLKTMNKLHDSIENLLFIAQGY